MNGIPRAWPLITGMMLVFPMSTAPPAIAAETAEPLFAFWNVTSIPALRKSPAFCA